MNDAPPIPLLHEGDSYQIYVDPSLPVVSLLRVILYPNNQNRTGIDMKYFDLDPQARRAVLQQVQRRYPGRGVKI